MKLKPSILLQTWRSLATFRKTIWLEYKNLSWEWGWNRKTCHKDHLLASGGLPSDDKWWSWGIYFLSHPHTNNRFFFLLTIKYHRLPEVPEYAEMRHNIMMSLEHNYDLTCLWICSCSFVILPLGWYRICAIEVSHMGKNRGILNLVSKKFWFFICSIIQNSPSVEIKE